MTFEGSGARLHASMIDHEANEDSPSGSGQFAASTSGALEKDKVLPNCDPKVLAGLAKSNGLTPEEQMALYEKQLKEDDWGHQPC